MNVAHADELALYVSGLAGRLAADDTDLLALKTVETARIVTGLYNTEAAVAAVKNDPTAQERFRKAMIFLLAIESRVNVPGAPAEAVVDEKDLFQSRTTWGVLVPAVAMLANHYGFDLGDQQSLVDVLSLLAGGLVVLWGRAKAVKRITSIAGVPINAKP